MSLISSLTINNGAPTTTSRNVVVTAQIANILNAPTHYQISENANDLSPKGWIPCIPLKAKIHIDFQLSPARGVKTVYVSFKDATNNPEVHSAQIERVPIVCYISPFWEKTSELGFNATTKFNKTPINTDTVPVYDTDGNLFGEFNKVADNNLIISGKGKITYNNSGIIPDHFLSHGVIVGSNQNCGLGACKFNLKLFNQNPNGYRYDIIPVSSEPYGLNDSRIENPYNLFGYIECDAINQLVQLPEGGSTSSFEIEVNQLTPDTTYTFEVKHQHPLLKCAFNALKIELLNY